VKNRKACLQHRFVRLTLSHCFRACILPSGPFPHLGNYGSNRLSPMLPSTYPISSSGSFTNNGFDSHDEVGPPVAPRPFQSNQQNQLGCSTTIPNTATWTVTPPQYNSSHGGNESFSSASPGRFSADQTDTDSLVPSYDGGTMYPRTSERALLKSYEQTELLRSQRGMQLVKFVNSLCIVTFEWQAVHFSWYV